MNQRNHLLLAIGTGGFFILLDQILKYTARINPDFHAYLWKPYVGWEYFANPGIAFSLPFPNWLIIIATPIILFVIIHFSVKHKNPTSFFLIGIVLILSGAISNYIDRVLFGVTIDYLRLFTSILNVADILIVAGTILLLFAEWQSTHKKEKFSWDVK